MRRCFATPLIYRAITSRQLFGLGAAHFGLLILPRQIADFRYDSTARYFWRIRRARRYFAMIFARCFFDALAAALQAAQMGVTPDGLPPIYASFTLIANLRNASGCLRAEAAAGGWHG